METAILVMQSNSAMRILWISTILLPHRVQSIFSPSSLFIQPLQHLECIIRFCFFLSPFPETGTKKREQFTYESFSVPHSTIILTTRLQNFCQCCTAARMCTHHLGIASPCFLHRAFYHLVGYRIGK